MYFDISSLVAGRMGARETEGAGLGISRSSGMTATQEEDGTEVGVDGTEVDGVGMATDGTELDGDGTASTITGAGRIGTTTVFGTTLEALETLFLGTSETVSP